MHCAFAKFIYALKKNAKAIFKCETVQRIRFARQICDEDK